MQAFITPPMLSCPSIISSILLLWQRPKTFKMRACKYGMATSAWSKSS